MTTQNWESPQYDARFSRRSFEPKDQKDILKGVVEIIKNGIDAYLREKGEKNCDKEKIDIKINSAKKTIKIINRAEGMDSQTFKEALKIGSDTSGEIGSGAHGYGMKEAVWAFKRATIISVKNRKCTSREFRWNENKDPQSSWSINNRGEEIKDIEDDLNLYQKTEIYGNGTYFEGQFSKEISFPQFETIHRILCDHILLRTINQSNLFDLRLYYENKERSSLPIKYDLPKIKQIRDDQETLKEGNFQFIYPNYGNIFVKYKIYLSSQTLKDRGDERTAGLLICADRYSVLDCTLFENSGNIASKFFGQVDLSGEKLRDILKTDMVVGFKRDEGLKKQTPIYNELYNKFNPILSNLIEEEKRRQNKKRRDSRPELISNKFDLIKELNKINREENNNETTDIKGDIKFFVGENGIRFTLKNNYLSLIEKQERTIHLVANTDIIPPKSEIEITTNKEGLYIEPLKFLINDKEIKNNLFKKKITFRGDDIDFYEVKAVTSKLRETKINVEVKKDNRLHINKPIFFFPDEQDIVSGKKKDFSLIVNKEYIQQTNIKIEYDDTIFQINKKSLNLKNLEKICGEIYELKISIYPQGKAGKGGKIKVKIDEFDAILKLKIINPRDKHLRGDFEGIEDDDEIEIDSIESVAYYQNKKICIYINHPILKHYATSGGEISIEYRIMYADAIVQAFCHHQTRKKVRQILGENANSEDFRVEYQNIFNSLYKGHAKKLHSLCVNPEIIKKLKKE